MRTHRTANLDKFGSFSFRYLCRAAQRFGDNCCFRRHVLRNIEMLPTATPATSGHKFARWRDTMRRRAKNLNDVCSCKIFFVRRNLDRDLLTRDCAIDENDSTIGQSRQPVATCDHAFNSHIFVNHHREP